ncbi:group II intron reverse transcriptase/maturase, partial [Staphylococcus pseudintermedius]
MYEEHVKEKTIDKKKRRSRQEDGIEGTGEVAKRKKGETQGGVKCTILWNIYQHEEDKELEKRGNRFVRYADELVIFV